MSSVLGLFLLVFYDRIDGPCIFVCFLLVIVFECWRFPFSPRNFLFPPFLYFVCLFLSLTHSSSSSSFRIISRFQRALGHLGLVDVDETTHHGASPLLLHPYASASGGASSALSSSPHSSANHHFVQQQQQHHQQQLQPQQQQRQSYHRSVSSSPPGEAEGGGPVPVIEFPDDEVFCPISFSRSLLTVTFGFWLWL